MRNPFLPAPDIRISIPDELTNEQAILNHLGVSAKELKRIWWFRENMYREFEIQKPSGKIRIITAPDDRLKCLQQKLAPLLSKFYRVRNPVHGFVPEKSVKTNANAHLRKKYILNIDLKDFFPSITENRIIGVLTSIGIDGRVSEIIARICCYNNHLPQGAPTSPVLSNIICFRLDKELLAFAKNVRCIYTRYADDITFSSYQPMAMLFEGSIPAAGHFPPELLTSPLRDLINSNGFTINPSKAHYADRHSRRMVTGLKVNQFVNVDRRYVRNIRATLRSVETLGIAAAEARYHAQYGGKSDLVLYLQGKISWLRFIRGQSDPVFRSIAMRFNASFPAHKIEINPLSIEIRDRAVWVVEYCIDTSDGLKAFQGSAFFLKNVGLVTAAHCVLYTDNGVERQADEIEVYHPLKPSNKFKVGVRRYNNDRDLAILDHNILTTEYYELESSIQTIAIGDELTAIGYPGFGPGDGINVRNGEVSSLPVKSGVQLIEVTQKLTQGMSGGPLLDKDFAVVGIIHKGGPSEGRDFAIHIQMLREWLAEAAAEAAIPTEEKISA